MHNFFRIELRVRQVPSTAAEYNLSIHFLFMIPLSFIMMDYSCYQGGVTQYNTMVNNAFLPQMYVLCAVDLTLMKFQPQKKKLRKYSTILLLRKIKTQVIFHHLANWSLPPTANSQIFRGLIKIVYSGTLLCSSTRQQKSL